MKIVIATDFHLSNRLYGLEELEENFYDRYNELIRMTLGEEPDLFIQLGDIFDTPYPKPIAIKVYKEGIEILDKAGVECYGIIGNHTLVQRKGFYPIDKIFEKMTVLDNDFIIKDNVFIGGVTYHPKTHDIKTVIDDLYKASVGCSQRILLLHQGLKGDIEIGYDFDESSLGLERFDYVFCGHFHKKILRRNFDTGTVYHYPGSLNSCNIVEMRDEMSEGRGFSILDTDSNTLQMKVIEQNYPYVQYNLRNDDLNDEMIDEIVFKLKGYERKPILQLNIETNSPKDVYNYVEKTEPYTLMTKYKIIQNETFTLDLNEVNEGMSIDKMLRESFEEEWKGDLAVELFKLLSTNRIEEAKSVADEVFKTMF